MVVVHEFMDYLAARNASAYTLRNYQHSLETFLTWCGQTPEHVTTKHVNDWLTMLGQDGQAPGTINGKLAALKAFFGFLMQQGVRAENPAASVKSATLPQAAPKAIPYHEVARVLDSIQGDTFLTLRDKALMELGYAIGARVSDLRGADRKHLDFSTQTLYLSTETSKGKKDAVVCFGEVAAQALHRYLTARDAMGIGREEPALLVTAFGTRLSSVWAIVKKYTTVAPHAFFRHSCATHLLEAGSSLTDVKEHLRHASVTTTQRYTRPGLSRLQASYRAHFPRAVATS